MLETGWSKVKVLASGEGCYCSLLSRQRLDATSFRGGILRYVVCLTWQITDGQKSEILYFHPLPKST